MRIAVWIAVAATALSGTAVAQPARPAVGGPPVLPVPITQAPPPVEFGVGESLPGILVPTPVTGAPIEVPLGPMFWVEADYLMWRANGGLVPPLVVGVYTSARPPLPVDARMAFPVSDDRINGALQSGYRLRAGMWIDKPHGTGLEAVFTSFLHASDLSTFFGGSNTILARPLVDVNQRAAALFQLSSPTGTLQGAAAVRTTFDSDGLELNMLRRGPAMIGEEMHWVLGVRYWGLDESLTVEGASQSSFIRAGAFDSFSTTNRFIGPQVGGQWHWDSGRMSIDLGLKLAVGGMIQETRIEGGSTAILPSGNVVDRPGGLLALRSNMGDHDRTRLVWMRDASINLGYRVADNVQLRLGYQFFWASSVLRPGQQIDLGVNPTLLPFSGAAARGVPGPWYRADGEIFWMHGINLGIAVQF